MPSPVLVAPPSLAKSSDSGIHRRTPFRTSLQPSADGAAAPCAPHSPMPAYEPTAIGYINAHGTATLANDATETVAIRQVFGAHADRLAVSSTKSMHGHTLGAAGAIEAAATLLALHHGILPPTANFTGSDPACDLDVIPNIARPALTEFALSNSFAFGGLNAVLAARRVRKLNDPCQRQHLMEQRRCNRQHDSGPAPKLGRLQIHEHAFVQV